MWMILQKQGTFELSEFFPNFLIIRFFSLKVGSLPFKNGLFKVYTVYTGTQAEIMTLCRL